MSAPDASRSELTVFAPDGVGEVEAGADLASLVAAAVAADPRGPLRSGDIVVVTSKIVSKAEGRTVPALDREEAVTAGSVRTVARRGMTRIVRTPHRLTLAGAGVDNSNVRTDSVLLLPADADASAAALRRGLEQRGAGPIGVVVSDTAGRAWRIGQVDQAIGAAGVRVVQRYAGQQDAYGNELHVTAMALADELAAAADLVKSKLAGRPVAVVRGLADLVGDDEVEDAYALTRTDAEDMFGFGSVEAVLVSALAATGQLGRYEEVLAHPPADRAEVVLAGATLEPAAADLLRRMLDCDFADMNALRTSG